MPFCLRSFVLALVATAVLALPSIATAAVPADGGSLSGRDCMRGLDADIRADEGTVIVSATVRDCARSERSYLKVWVQQKQDDGTWRTLWHVYGGDIDDWDGDAREMSAWRSERHLCGFWHADETFRARSVARAFVYPRYGKRKRIDKDVAYSSSLTC